MYFIKPLLFIFLTSGVLVSTAQSIDSSINLSTQLPEKYYAKVDKKLSSVNEQLSKKSVKYLAKFQRQEEKLQKKLNKLNPENVMANANEKYKELSQKIKSKRATTDKIISGVYNANLDSLGTSLSFLKQFNGLSDKVKEPLKSFDLLQSKLQQSEKITAFIAERKQQVKEILSRYTKLPAGLKKDYDNLSKTIFYYKAQVAEIKQTLKDPKKIEQKALSLLTKLPAFQKFMKENGQLASLFRLPGNADPAQSLAGLQTRSSVQSLIQQRIASGGPDAQAQIQQNLAAAHAELNKLKDKINQFGNGGGDAEMPDLPTGQAGFKPNNQKTKPFLKRLEYSTDVQFTKSNNLLPSAANIGLGIGYKLNDKSILGIALSYKMGVGSLQHISITHQGIGFRSYGDWKIKKQFFATGGYEMNYNAAFKNIQQVSPFGGNSKGEPWQRSALLGVSKKYKISKKVKGEVKLLYDFLANEHVPVSEPFIFRLGYKF